MIVIAVAGVQNAPPPVVASEPIVGTVAPEATPDPPDVAVTTPDPPEVETAVETAVEPVEPAEQPQTNTINVSATFYTAFCDTGCTGVTATGVDVSNSIMYDGLRIIAVDPNVIPLWSIVNVSLSGGDSFTAIALDTGGAIKGNIIDVLVGDVGTARSLGRQTATISY